MCTVALAFRTYPGLPLLLAANRDELRARPSVSWAHDAALGVMAPRDAVAGGTWVGVNRRGALVAITNRAGAVRDPTRRSRGLVVLDALTAPSVEAALAQAAALSPDTVSPFHLLVADASGAGLVVHDGARLTRHAIEPGWTVITERSWGAATAEREAYVRAALAAHTDAPPSVDALRGVLSRHLDEERLAASCVHLDELGYGTRSSSIVAMPNDVRAARLWHAEGPPCVTPYAEIAGLGALWEGAS